MMTMVVRPFGPRILRSRRGLASVEAVPLLIIFVMLTAFALGFWGSIHTGILHSIAARTYAFETFRNRSNLTMFRENISPRSGNYLSLVSDGIRIHAVRSESQNQADWLVTERPLAVGYPSPVPGANQLDHLNRIYNLQPRNQSVAVGPMWIMVSYGMCLDARCGR